MDAFLFTLALFVFWVLLGFATVSIFRPRLRILQTVLVSPAVGIAVIVLPVFFINRAGIPIKEFGRLLMPALAVVAIASLTIRRPVFPGRWLLPYIAVLVVALTLAAWPMFNYGFDWVSFANDDMANYCLAAERFLNHGFFDQPNLDDLFAGKDYSLIYWFMHVAGGVRSGSELMLATVSAFSGLNPHQIFMPVIMALHLALLASVGAMTSARGYKRSVPLIAMGLLALSPLTTLGAVYQLIGQVGGLSLAVAAVTLMYRPYRGGTALKLVIGCVPSVLIFSCLFIWYPEILPFFGLGWFVYLGLILKQKRMDAFRVLLPALIIGIFAFLVLNKYIVSSTLFLLKQASGGMQSADLSTVLFPYFLVPSGIAAFWGVLPIVGSLAEPFMSASILVSIGLFVWIIWSVMPRQIGRALAPVSMLLVMMTMGFLLFFRNNDFGLFKLAMFAQPFFAAVIAIELTRLSWHQTSRLVKVGTVTMLLPLGMVQSVYVNKSTGEFFGGLNEIPRASAQKVNVQFKKLFDSIKDSNPNGFLADTSNIVLAKFQAMYSQGESLIFPSRNFFVNIIELALKDASSAESMQLGFNDLKNKQFVEYKMNSNAGPNKFYMLANGASQISQKSLITTVEKQTIFNGMYPTSGDGYFQYIESPQNHLVFVHSDLGNHYYFGDRKKISYYQLENDPMFPSQKFSSLGEHLLFLVLKPTDKPRVVMELTDTVVKQFGSELPKPKVQDVVLGFVGRGTGRVFSDPIRTTPIDGMQFVEIDMSRSARQFQNITTGLMNLYGRDVPADQRRITAFGRDISLLSEEQYQALIPPAHLQNFPADLANKGLEYSGIYEDGWISEKSFFRLAADPQHRHLTIKGVVPQINDPNFSTVLTLSVEGREVASRKLGLGEFSIDVPVSDLQGKKRVDVVFNKDQQLPGLDGRIAGGLIKYIGFN